MKRVKTWLAAVLLAVAALPAAAPAQSTAMIRDEETERYLRSIADPLFQASGLHAGSVKLYIMQDPVLNAFVAGGQKMFINTGLLMESDDPSMLSGVIAHETGHIAGGHLARKAGELESATLQATLGTVLGVASIAAGAPPEAGAAIISGSRQVASRNLLKHSREHEEAADQAAITLLKKTGGSLDGLLGLLKKFSSEQARSLGDITPYVLTHPLSMERIAHLQAAMDADKALSATAPEALRKRHARVQAKLDGFLKTPEEALRAYPEERNDVPARYARAVAYYRLPDMPRALEEIGALIASAPEDPYFHELKGQMLFETGRVAESIASYETAVRLLPDSALLRLELAAALIASGGDDRENLARAARYLETVVAKEPDNVTAWHQLGIAYGRGGDLGQSYLALAEKSLLLNALEDTERFISLAEKNLGEGQASLRLQDIKALLERRKKDKDGFM